MAYDLEKYREKREKVLGVKKRGLSFGTWAGVVAVVIVIGLGVVAVPESIEYLATRNLDDAIFRLRGNHAWPANVIAGVSRLEGVKNALTDKGGNRLVVTFDRSVTDLKRISGLLNEKGVQAVMLNRVNHRQRRSTLAEEAEFEAL